MSMKKIVGDWVDRVAIDWRCMRISFVSRAGILALVSLWYLLALCMAAQLHVRRWDAHHRRPTSSRLGYSTSGLYRP